MAHEVGLEHTFHAQYISDGQTLPPMLDIEWPRADWTGLDAGYNMTPAQMSAWIGDALRAHANGRYLTAEHAGNSPLIASRTAIGSWERFKLVLNSDGSIGLLANTDGRYVTAEQASGSPLIASSTALPPDPGRRSTGRQAEPPPWSARRPRPPAGLQPPGTAPLWPVLLAELRPVPGQHHDRSRRPRAPAGRVVNG